MAQRSPLFHLILALCLALGAAYFTLNWLLSQKPAEVAPAPVEETRKEINIVVAAKAMPIGTKITADSLKLSPYYEQSVPKGSFSEVKPLEGRFVAQYLAENDPITPGKLYPEDFSGGGLEVKVTPGKRAMSVRGTKEMGFAGLIAPGSHVDVLMTAEIEPSKHKVSKLVVSNVLVLASGPQMERRSDKPTVDSFETLTLLVTSEEAEQLALTQQYATLTFILRNPLDTATVLTSGADAEKNLSSYRSSSAPEAVPAEPLAPPPNVSVQIESIRGNKVERTNLEKVPAGK